MIYSSIDQQNKITFTDLMFQIKGHGGISITMMLSNHCSTQIPWR